jgi:DNA polymerase-3 subunit gamma/tau
MGYQVLARKYRPQRFADVAGQDHVTTTLRNALTQNRVAHGYIFSGHRGIGKTTIARILAQALNCRTEIGSPQRPTPEPCGICDSCIEIKQGNAVDVIEIDAATNRGIDEIRELRDAARYAPSRDRYKIYILDEAHQITDAAFNALLKTLEEPPAHVIFMMATTEPENIPQTIRSRCQHFSFHAVKFDDILAQLKMISEQENVTAEDAALALLSEAGDGSMRDALSIMDQAIASAPHESGRAVLSADLIRDLMGAVPNAVFERLLEAVAAGQTSELMEQLNVLLNHGHSPSSLARQMVRYLRNTLMAKIGGEQTELLQISTDERSRATRTALLFSEEEITRNLQIVLRTFDDLNYRQEQRFHLELGLLKLIHAQRLLPMEELLSAVASGARAPAAAAPRTAAPTPSRPNSPAPRAASTDAVSSASPFGPSGGSWTTGPVIKQSATTAPTPIALVPALEKHGSAAQESSPFPATSASPEYGTATVTEGALAVATEISSAPTSASVTALSVEAIQTAIVNALSNSGHGSAAQLLGTSTFALDGASLRIEVPGVGKKMISLTINAAAEKLMRQEMQKLGGPTRFTVVPGTGSAATASVVAAPAAGSVNEAALAHPMVEKAREIFKAEVRSVVDLRQK